MSYFPVYFEHTDDKIFGPFLICSNPLSCTNAADLCQHWFHIHQPLHMLFRDPDITFFSTEILTLQQFQEALSNDA